MVLGVFASGWARRWWGTIGRHYYTPGFQAFIDKALAGGVDNRGEYWDPMRERL